MKRLQTLMLTLALLLLLNSLIAQELKRAVTDSEIAYITEVFEDISEKDQRYRSYLQYGTLDDEIIQRIDSILNNVGIEEGFKYQKSLNLSLSASVKDSLLAMQHALDFQNHIILRGLWATYGYIPEEVVEEKNFVQMLLLLHPPKDWDIPTFHKEYSNLLKAEVMTGRMPAKSYATFHDNILCKIMRKPQLYGTNEQFDPKAGKVLPPIIADLAEANKARAEIGLPVLEEGEYRLAK